MTPDAARILAADDAPDNLRLLGRMLKRWKYDVRLVPDGPSALSSALAEPPDLILLDILMPGMDGYEVCERLKADERTRDIPVLFISALQETFDKVRAFSLGGVDYIAKPFQEEEVLIRVRTHLSLGRMRRMLALQNAKLKQEINDRKKAEEHLERINDCFLNFVPNPLENIRRLTAISGDLLSGACAAYIRAGKGAVCAWSAEGGAGDKTALTALGERFCREAALQQSQRPMIIRDPAAAWPEIDNGAGADRFRTLVGQTVAFGKDFMGALCVAYEVAVTPGREDMKIMEILAAAIGVEEARKESKDALKGARDELERKVIERTSELDIKNKSLEELNTALKVLLKQREADRRKLEDNILSNVKRLALPYLDKVKAHPLDDRQKAYLAALEANLNEIVSPFASKLSSRCLSLTPTEIQVADFIRQGKSTKEIAGALTLSYKTIESHRENIRGKLGIKNQKINLRSCLLSLD